MMKWFDFFRKKKVIPKKEIPKVEWEDVEPMLTPFKRTAWMPKTMAHKSPRRASKFSGAPVLNGAEKWPCCGNCHQPMQLFVQLNSQDLPPEAGRPFGDGFLQAFYCTNWEQECEIECDSFLPFSKGTLVRIVAFDSITDERDLEPPVKNVFPESQIIGWEATEDYPCAQELVELEYSPTEGQAIFMFENDITRPKDKLLGWPFWVQGVEYPDCPDCGEPMEYIFQIDSEDHLPYMFGGNGCAHISRCKVHGERLTMAWACP